MKAQNKLHIASGLMVAGLVPLLIGCYAMFDTLLVTDYHKPTEVGLAMLAIGKAIFAYLFAVFISGSGAAWSVLVERRNGDAQLQSARTVRTVVLIMLVVPLVLASIARL